MDARCTHYNDLDDYLEAKCTHDLDNKDFEGCDCNDADSGTDSSCD